jgi:LysR family hydrogen peroxide-inducible transcriptional activator
MVASGVGITVLPWLATPGPGKDGLLRYIPLESPPPSRRVSIVWRKSYTRTAAIVALRSAILALTLPGVTMLPDAAPVSH